MRKGVAILAGLIILALANYSIYSRERLLTEGNVVFLQLAPIDPRSLMQGDYMALRFQVANDVRSRITDELPGDGFAVGRRQDRHQIGARVPQAQNVAGTANAAPECRKFLFAVRAQLGQHEPPDLFDVMKQRLGRRVGRGQHRPAGFALSCE